VKKLFKLLSAAIVSTAFIGTMTASAATCDGTISVTGPVSNNQITCTDVNNIVLTCDNNIIVGTVNTQTGTSGNASGNNNTTGGSAVTGSVVNENGQDVTIGASCDTLPAAAPVTPGQGGGGGGGGGGGAAMPEELPNTSGTQILPLLIGTVAASAVAVVLSRLGLAAYRRLATK
jgi:hypothetical protein